KLKAAGVAFFYVDREVVVVAFRPIIDALKDAPDGKWSVIPSDRVALGVGRNLVEVQERFQIGSMTTGIRETKACTESQIPLKRKVPLMDRGIMVVNRKRIIKSLRAGNVEIGRERRWIRQRRVPAAVEALVVVGHAAGMDGPTGDQGKSQRCFDESSVSAADHCLVVMKRAPCETNARTKITLVGVAKLVRNAGLRCGQDGCGCNGLRKCRDRPAESLRIRDDNRAINGFSVYCSWPVGGKIGRVLIGCPQLRVTTIT